MQVMQAPCVLWVVAFCQTEHPRMAWYALLLSAYFANSMNLNSVEKSCGNGLRVCLLAILHFTRACFPSIDVSLTCMKMNSTMWVLQRLDRWFMGLAVGGGHFPSCCLF